MKGAASGRGPDDEGGRGPDDDDGERGRWLTAVPPLPFTCAPKLILLLLESTDKRRTAPSGSSTDVFGVGVLAMAFSKLSDAVFEVAVPAEGD